MSWFANTEISESFLDLFEYFQGPSAIELALLSQNEVALFDEHGMFLETPTLIPTLRF